MPKTDPTQAAYVLSDEEREMMGRAWIWRSREDPGPYGRFEQGFSAGLACAYSIEETLFAARSIESGGNIASPAAVRKALDEARADGSLDSEAIKAFYRAMGGETQ